MTNRSKRGFLAVAPKRSPLGKCVGDKHCLSRPGLSSGIDVEALSLQLSSPNGTTLSKSTYSGSLLELRTPNVF